MILSQGSLLLPFLSCLRVWPVSYLFRKRAPPSFMEPFPVHLCLSHFLHICFALGFTCFPHGTGRRTHEPCISHGCLVRGRQRPRAHFPLSRSYTPYVLPGAPVFSWGLVYPCVYSHTSPQNPTFYFLEAVKPVQRLQFYYCTVLHASSCLLLPDQTRSPLASQR